MPTVTIATDSFISLAKSTQVSQGMTDMCFVTAPHPLGMIPRDEVEAKADLVFQDVLAAATTWEPQAAAAIAELKPYPAPRINFTGTATDVLEMFRARNWCLSIPFIPPTADRVAEMLKGTDRDPAEVVWVVPPRQGMLTVELVATLGVMAGSKPEHMPLLLAAVEAFSNPDAAWRGTSTTTAATSPMIIISGPIIKKLNLNYGTGVIGPQNPITNSLGYFVNLMGDVVGGSVPPEIDMSTQGSAADFVVSVFVENDEANPWGESFAVAQGFKPTDSVLTVYTGYPPSGNIDRTSATPKDYLDVMSMGIARTASGSGGGCLNRYSDDPALNSNSRLNQVMVMLSPYHAGHIAEAYTKEEAADYIAKNAVLPIKSYAPGRCKPGPEYGEVTPDTLMPRFQTGESIRFVVTGGDGTHSQYWVNFSQVRRPVSVIIPD